ncbi:MAG TPA: Asd/ArgC dimerization domain-containing protein [Bryobacteraceae bacterium]|nr:Asd/ArgC dimerization domain-containing protein [Bryobacteraceae bacterium]
MAEHSTTFALVGSDSLLGREIRDIVATSASGMELRLIAAEEEHAGTLTRVGDEPSLVEVLGVESLAGVSAVFLAGSAASSHKALELVENDDPGIVIIDLTYSTEERPEARLRAPLVEATSDDESVVADSSVHVIAHPAAVALALFLRRLHEYAPIQRSVIEVFVPASEYGAAGVEELQQQTVSLLSFKSLPRAIFDAQLSFSLLARYGEEAPVALDETELRIERHLASLLALPGEGAGVTMPSLRVIQAPVFHGYSFSAWVEFDENPGVEMLESSLSADSIEVRGREFEPPTNVGQAGQSGIAVGAIVEDRNQPDACWFWMVADNLRLLAENAVAVARELL